MLTVAAAGLHTEKVSDLVKDIPGNDVIKAIEETHNLKRQCVFLQQQLVEKDRRIKILETMVRVKGID